jgi:UPF0042 nucleotide-binding protein
MNNKGDYMELIIISGCSGAGKSCALHALEDEGYYCIDNLPITLIDKFPSCLNIPTVKIPKIAISMDIRNFTENVDNIQKIISTLNNNNVNLSIIYLDSTVESLLLRYKTTRRRHPLDNQKNSLREAIELEKKLLKPLLNLANFTLDTSSFSIYKLKNWIKNKFCYPEKNSLSITLESFGFKKGIPEEADFVFDVRCLPNPFWIEELRPYTGLQQPVIDYLERKPKVKEMITDIDNFLSKWVSEFNDSGRAYLIIAIGCTGGKHRSVYICDYLAQLFNKKYNQVKLIHRELMANDYQTGDDHQ